MTWLGLLALACFSLHAAFHLSHHRPEDLLWACHVGAASVAAGLLTRSPTILAVGMLFLCVGVPIWAVDVLTSGELTPTSAASHLGGLAIGIAGAFGLGMPRHVWWKAAISLALLLMTCRLLTPERANVNLVFRVQPGWESWFPSHAWYLALMFGTTCVLFFLIELGFRKLVSRS